MAVSAVAILGEGARSRRRYVHIVLNTQILSSLEEARKAAARLHAVCAEAGGTVVFSRSRDLAIEHSS